MLLKTLIGVLRLLFIYNDMLKFFLFVLYIFLVKIIICDYINSQIAYIFPVQCLKNILYRKKGRET